MKRRVPVTRWKVTLGFAAFLAIGTLVETYLKNPQTKISDALIGSLLIFVVGIVAGTLFRNNLNVTREVTDEEEIEARKTDSEDHDSGSQF